MNSNSIPKIGQIAIVLSSFFVTGGVLAKVPAKPFGVTVRISDVLPRCPEQICDIEVAPATLSDRTHGVSRRDIESAIEQAGFNSRDLKAPKKKRKTQATGGVSEETLRLRILGAVKKILPRGVYLEKLNLLSEIEVPKSGFDAVAHWPVEASFQRRVLIPVDLLSEGVKFLTIEISAFLVVEIAVPVAVRDIQQGTVIAPDDLRWETIRLDSTDTKLVKSPFDIVGKKVLVPIPAGSPFDHRVLNIHS